MFFTKNIFKASLVLMLWLLNFAGFAFAAPKMSKGLTFNYVGKDGNLEYQFNHMRYIPIKITASTGYIRQVVTIEGRNFSDSVSLCTEDHCGYAPMDEPHQVTACNIKGTTTLSPNQSCFLWLKANDYANQLPFHKPQQQAQFNIYSHECLDDSCTMANITNYYLRITMDVDNSLYAGGYSALYAYNGEKWSTLVPVNGGPILSMALFQGDIYFGGKYTSAQDNLGRSGKKYLNKVVSNGIGTAYIMPMSVNWDGAVAALAVFGDDYSLEIGGEFTNYYAWLRKDGIVNFYPLPDNKPVKAITTGKAASSREEIFYWEYVNTGLKVVVWNPETSTWGAFTSGGSGSYTIKYFTNIYGSPGVCKDAWWSEVSGITKTAVLCYDSSGNQLANYMVGTGGTPDDAFIYAIDINENLNKVIIGGKFSGYGITNLSYSTGTPQDFMDGDSTWDKLSQNFTVDGNVYALLSVGPYEFVGGNFNYLCNNTTNRCDIPAHDIAYFSIQNGKDLWYDIPKVPEEGYGIISLIMATSINNVKLEGI